MPSPVDPGAGERQAEQLGLPPGLKVGSVFPFGGLNVTDSRLGIEDKEFSWLENYIRIGKSRLRTTYDVGKPLYTVPSGGQIVSFYWYNIGSVSYCAVFLADGTAVQVEYPAGTVKQISSTIGQFYTAGALLPACCPWGSQYLLISNNLTANSYWVWDGTLLYAAGGVSPIVTITSGGSGYTSTPGVDAYGGSGSGATFVATVVNGSVVSITPTATGSGYGPSDTVQLLVSGGGSDTGAALTAVLSVGALSNLILTSGGSGYTTAPTVTIVGGDGSGATATATLIAGGVASISLTAGGTGYTSAPSVVLVGGAGSGATAVATVSGGAVTSINLTNAGSGYTSAPSVMLSGGAGTGAAATANLLGSMVSAVVVTNVGSGYSSAPSVTFTGGGGSGAAAVAVLNPGGVVGITVNNGGTNFSGTPTLTITGGGGSGAEATAVMSGGSIASVGVTATGSGYTSVPTVTVETGINNAASATVAMMPIGISGAVIETFQSRAWLMNPFQAGTLPAGGQINISAPGGFIDFATSDGGLLFTNSDRFLRSRYNGMHQSNGYLYTLGDSSTGVINNVQSSGNPVTTTFNYLNVDPQTGTSWRDTVQDFARNILFANPYGVWGIYGGAVSKVSKKLDPIFDNAFYPPNSGALTPSAAVAEIYSQRLYLLLLTIKDPFTQLARNVMLAWDETDWSVLSSAIALTYIGTQEINSDPQAWGTDGTQLVQLFTTPSATLPKTLQTKYFASESAFIMEQAYAVYLTVQNRSAGQTSLSFSSVTVDAIGLASPLNLPAWMADEVPAQGGSFQLENPIAFPTPALAPVTFGTAIDPPVAGSGIGLTMVTSAPDYELNNLQFGYMDVHGIA